MKSDDPFNIKLNFYSLIKAELITIYNYLVPIKINDTVIIIVIH